VRGVSDVLENVMEKTAKGQGQSRERGVAETQAKFDPGALRIAIADLEKQMREAAANLEFEDAARIRDEIKRLSEND